MKPAKDYTLILMLALFLVAALCSCGVFKPSSGHCPTNDKNYFFKHK